MREILPKYMVAFGKEVGRPPFPYKHPQQGKFLPGGAQVCPGGQYFDNPSLGTFDEEAMLATTNRSFKTEHLSDRGASPVSSPKPSPRIPQQRNDLPISNYFRTTYGEKHSWPIPVQTRPSTSLGINVHATKPLAAKPPDPHEAKVTLGPPFSVYQPSMDSRGNVLRNYEPRNVHELELSGKQDGISSLVKAEANQAGDTFTMSPHEEEVSTKCYGGGTGFSTNYEGLAQTRTTKGLRGNAWTKDEFSDTYRTTYSDMLVTGFSTTRRRPGSAGRVLTTNWDKNRPRGLKRP
jgi:hypothetical protein